MMSVLGSFEETCRHFYCSDKNAVLMTDEVLPKLTLRETEVLHSLAIGSSSKQIAAALHTAI